MTDTGRSAAKGWALPSRVTALLCMSMWMAASAPAELPDPPPFYAVKDVRVVVGNGDVLEGATVLVADGLIEAVGVGLEIPADARVIEGGSLTVYPGLIDPLTGLGLASEATESRDSRGGSDGPGGNSSAPAPVLGPETRPATEPWREAGDFLDPEADFESWRQAGFTSAMTVKDGGFFNGRGSVIHLGAGDPKDRVLARSVAQHMGLDPIRSFRLFPSSLMGVLSYVDQTLMDTRHYMKARAAYEKSPTGRQRPRFEASLEALAEDLEQGRAFLIPADNDLEIDRVLGMAEKHQLRPVIYGGQGAYARRAELSKADVPVLINLDWPEENKDRDPDADTSFRELYHRRMSVQSPAMLASAGVPFAFYSAGLGSPSQVFEKVRAAVEAGLDEQVALRAMTSGAAEILGLDDRLGTVEKGKIANLVVATDLPWAEDVEVQGVFVDGRYFFERKEDEGEKEPPASDVSGTWALQLQTPGGARDITATLEMDEEGKVSGELESERGTSQIEKGRMSADRLTFESTRTGGGRTMTASYTLMVEGERVDGTLSAGSMVLDLNGERTAKAEEKDGAEEAEEVDEVTADELESAMAVFQGPAKRLGSFVVTHAKVFTVTGEPIENGTVIVRDGKIDAVGEGLDVPAGLEVFDADGGSLIPGIIDAHSHIAIDGAGNEGSLAVTSMVTIQDVIDPHDIAIYRALAGGVTSINVLHGSANPIGGGNAVLKLRWGSNADGMRFEGAPPGIKFALGENPKRSRSTGRSGPRRYPATRMGVMDVIRQAFLDAKAYQKGWADYRATSKGGSSVPPRVDRKLEPLVEILEGKRLVHSHSYRADEILQLLRLAEEMGFKVATLQHVLEGYKVADEIAAHGAGASTFSDWWGYKVEAYDAIPHNAALMTERGVSVSVNSDSAEEMRHLNQEAAKAMHWGGLSHEQALRLVTLNPAEQLGIDHRVGSIEVGKDADLVLYDGDPLSVRSVVQKTFIDGDLYFDIELDRERQATIDGIKARLNPPKDEDSDEGDGEETGDEPDTKAEDPGAYEELMTYSCRLHEGGH